MAFWDWCCALIVFEVVWVLFVCVGPVLVDVRFSFISFKEALYNRLVVRNYTRASRIIDK